MKSKNMKQEETERVEVYYEQIQKLASSWFTNTNHIVF
jgi:hypothetical protein